MPVRVQPEPLPDDCQPCWRECVQLLALAQQCIQRGEATGKDMTDCREVAELLMKRVEAIGWEYYPDDMPKQVIE